MSVPNLTGSWQTRCGYGTVLQSGWSPDGAGRVFRKFYTHCPPEVALYEYGCARWLHEHDIPSPRPIRLLEDSEGRKGIESEWLDLHLVRDAEAARAAQDVLALVRLLHRCPIWPQGRSWQVLVETEYLPELVRAADWYRSRLGESSLDGIEQAIAVFKDLRPDGFIHGDFSPNNVGYQGRALHCLDFRHGSEGPRDWDIGYFLCHFAPGEAIAREILAKTTAGVAALATVASAIRLGRRLRRGDDPVPGLHRLLDWISWQRRLDDQAVELPAATVEFAVEFMRRGLLDDAQRMLAPIARFATPQGRAARLNIAVINHVRGRFNEAQRFYERELCLGEAAQAALCNNLGILHMQLRRRELSLEWLRKAEALAPGTVAFAATRLAWFHSFRHYIEGIRAFEALHDRPTCNRLAAIVHNSGASLYSATGDWLQASRYWQLAQQADPCHWNAPINHALAAGGRLPAETVARQAADALQRKLSGPSARALTPCVRPEHSPQPALRLALVSSRIRRGKVGYLLRALLNHLDRQEFEIIVYDNSVVEDRFARPFKRLAHRWVPVFGWSADALAEQVRCDAIDILLDLDGYCPRNYSEAFALNPAPLQLGWPESPVPWTVQKFGPTDEDLTGFYALDSVAPLSRVPLRNGLRVAYIGDTDKLDGLTISLLSSVLDAVPQATLVIKSLDCDDPLLVEMIAGRFATCGIGRERINFVGFLKGHRNHLEFHSELDVVVDSVGRCSEIAVHEALQQGVPVLVLDADGTGGTPGARLLRRLGLSWLVARSVADIIHLCLLASRPDVLAGWRSQARAAFEADQQALPARGLALGAALRSAWAACSSHAWQPLQGASARYDVDAIDADRRWLVLTSCYGDQVLLSTFMP